MNRAVKEHRQSYTEIPIIIKDKLQHRYLNTDMYIIKDNKLYNLVEDVASEDLYVPLNKEQLLVYQEELDGSAISKEEARNKYPEEFI